ncbi:putative mRNA 3-end processing factor [Methylocella silvestris BL2]|uniref:Putative mRNA 3-end processing factor n=1 Tax=Methylocella silvestris (strain DSM 15510 / CIP 108128 / LMG 27833 / NCIMB 13906 / BL2) TaxID=395965 RepID=B8EP01_METSB|nr:ligase-associated DNA damage response exonuclease [Methylocella silvestris]ACK49239.1 putative mRNA 3-end processing factor [Methylocella silvestris BL2]
MASAHFLSLSPAGVYCAAGDFFIDPLRPVPRALITHGHSDHARPGHGEVLATRETLAIMAIRLGPGFAGQTQAIGYGEHLRLGSIDVSFHPAGHVIGSAQIRISDGRTIVVASGDYKREADPTCAGFEPIACDVFITEATFGLPVFRHSRTADEIARLLASQQLFPDRPHLVGAYALGKAQRVIALLRGAGYDRPIYLHGAMEKLCAFYAQEGVELGDLRLVAANDRAKLAGEIVICPPGALQDLWSRKFPDPVAAFASGWMRVRARARQRGVELPLVISDHADWDGLTQTIVETGCEKVLVTHGEADALVHWARGQGIEAEPLHLLGYGDEESDGVVPAETEA